MADLGGSPLQLNTCLAGGGRGHEALHQGLSGELGSQSPSLQRRHRTCPFGMRSLGKQGNKSWVGREEGMNWRLLHQVGAGTTHTPDGPGSQVAELPSPESDRASFTHHSGVLSPAVIGTRDLLAQAQGTCRRDGTAGAKDIWVLPRAPHILSRGCWL